MAQNEWIQLKKNGEGHIWFKYALEKTFKLQCSWGRGFKWSAITLSVGIPTYAMIFFYPSCISSPLHSIWSHVFLLNNLILTLFMQQNISLHPTSALAIPQRHKILSKLRNIKHTILSFDKLNISFITETNVLMSGRQSTCSLLKCMLVIKVCIFIIFHLTYLCTQSWNITQRIMLHNVKEFFLWGPI